MVAGSILEHIFEGVNGDSVYRGASFLAGKLGHRLPVRTSRSLTMARSRRIRHQPVRRRRHSDPAHAGDRNGVLKSYLLNTYTARKAGATEHRQRFARTGRNARHRSGKLLSASGEKDPKEVIGEIKEGLYVTEFLVTERTWSPADYSRGASGLWISGGELTYPVEEITVAGNLKDMFFNISEIANDLEFRGSVASRRCASTA